MQYERLWMAAIKKAKDLQIKNNKNF